MWTSKGFGQKDREAEAVMRGQKTCLLFNKFCKMILQILQFL